jgi:hypothetical protein
MKWYTRNLSSNPSFGILCVGKSQNQFESWCPRNFRWVFRFTRYLSETIDEKNSKINVEGRIFAKLKCLPTTHLFPSMTTYIG